MNLVIVGAGMFANTVADVAKQTERFNNIKFLDDNKTGEDIIGKCPDFQQFIKDGVQFFPAIGNNEIRFKWFKKLESSKADIATLVHPSSYVSPTSSVGKGSVVLPRAIVNTNCRVGNACIINCGAIIDHDCIIEDGAHICLGAIIKGENKITSCKKIEAGEIIQRGSC